MKKLLIAMTAAAVGTCAWATESAPTLLNENFNSDWANGAELEYMTALPEGKTLWSYSANPIGENEIKVVAQSEGDNALSLNTGSKKLNAKFAAGDVTIPAGRDTGLYFKSTVSFSDPSDTLPELGDNDKFALVVLDNIESVEEGSNTTNLWVIAGHKDDGKRAYLLHPFADDADSYDLTDSWFNTPKTIEVRAIQNVMATGNLAGFIVKVEDVICRVVKSYPIVNDVIDMSTFEGATYLGYSAEEIDATYRKRYGTDKTLIVSAASSSTLTSVDFQGQGVIDDVSLATTGSDFGTDAVVLTFTGYDADKIASITVGEKAAVNGVYTITGSETADGEGKVAIVVTVNEGYVLEGEGWTKNGLTYTYAGYTLPTASATITLNVFWPAAIVDGTAYPTFAKALEAAVTAGKKIQLADAITLESEPIQIESDVTIDLAGETIKVAGDFPAIYNAASTLTIEDSIGGGKVKGAVTGDGTFVITGGGFLASANTAADGKFTLEGSVPKNGYAVSGPTEDGYWVVAEKQTYAVTVNASANATVTGLTGGDVEAGTALKFQAVAKEGYKNLVVTAGDQVLEADADGYYNYTVNAAVTITITVEAKAEFAVAVNTTGATTTLAAGNYYEGTELSFTVTEADGYEAPFTVKAGEAVLEATGGTYTFTVNADVTITVVATKKVVVPLQPLPENATDADVSAALGTQADAAVTENIKTVADYTKFQDWAAKAGTDKVAGSENAYAAYVLDAAGLLDGTEKLADADIKVKAFAQDTAVEDAGTFNMEITIKNLDIGTGAQLDKLAELIIAEGTSDLGDETSFSVNNVVTKVEFNEKNGKVTFSVTAKAKEGQANMPDKFFFKIKFNK